MFAVLIKSAYPHQDGANVCRDVLRCDFSLFFEEDSLFFQNKQNNLKDVC